MEYTTKMVYLHKLHRIYTWYTTKMVYLHKLHRIYPWYTTKMVYLHKLLIYCYSNPNDNTVYSKKKLSAQPKLWDNHSLSLCSSYYREQKIMRLVLDWYSLLLHRGKHAKWIMFKFLPSSAPLQSTSATSA